MDLEHPAISRTLKEGYPDGAGKPQQKNTNPLYYNRVEEDEQMEFEKMAVSQLLEIGANVEVTFYKKTEREAHDLLESLNLDNKYVEKIESEFVSYLAVKNKDTKVLISYGGIF